MVFSGVRVFELIDIKAEDVNLDKHIFEITIKDNKIDTYSQKSLAKVEKCLTDQFCHNTEHFSKS